MYEVASKRVNIVDCGIEVLPGTSRKQLKLCRELTSVDQQLIIRHLGDWSFHDPQASRRQLVESLSEFLKGKGLTAEKGCIPSLIVQNRFPIEILRYTCERDLYELMGRMLWIQEQYGSAIGILFGVLNTEVAAATEEFYQDLFIDEDDVALMLA